MKNVTNYQSSYKDSLIKKSIIYEPEKIKILTYPSSCMGLTIEERRKKDKNAWNKNFYSDEDNRDRHNKQMREYYQLNKEKLIKKAKKYKKDNPEETKARNKKYYEENKERLKKRARIIARNKAKKIKLN